MKRSTINDVAKKAGVSKATVSHVINNTRFVEEPTKNRVLQAIQEIGYRPSNVARSLSDGRRVCMISGVNLPMLVRILNYPRLDAAEPAARAISGGRDGIFGSKADEGG